MNEVTPPAIWDGDRRITGTEDFHNDFDPTAESYSQPERPEYKENYRLLGDGRRHAAYSIGLPYGVPTKLLGEDPTREFFYINGNTPNSLIIGEQGSVAQGLGYIVNGAEKLSSNAEVWAAPIGGIIRHNGVPNPAMINDINGYTVGTGVGGAATGAQVVGGGPTGGNFLRATWTVAPTVIGGGVDMLTSSPLGNVVPGQPYSSAVWVRVSASQRLQLVMLVSTGGVTYQTATTPAVDCVANVWTQLTFSTPLVSSATAAALRVVAITGGNGRLWAPGDTLDVTQYIGEAVPNASGAYFDGTTPNAKWDGTVGGSTSTLYPAPLPVSYWVERRA